ncbi:MAG TPA: peptide-methionine (S)-S-oxide reductase MsrA [Bacteriovoracaceae bacterium]|nr:peptide-methionine (S)-S-oxide reductase MsrA [Bacteriovoracaceae bacterium]
MKTWALILSLLSWNTLGAKTMNKETATLAGGCFWGMEDIIRNIPGVLGTAVGYTGGKVDNPTYTIVKLGTTNHAESVQVEFDPKKLSYSDLLGFFFRMHDPTSENRQGNDKGTQYRSAIFYHSEEQKKTAQDVIEKISIAKKWPKPIVTQVVQVEKFYAAEDYHQDYLKKNPGGYTCHWMRD